MVRISVWSRLRHRLACFWRTEVRPMSPVEHELTDKLAKAGALIASLRQDLALTESRHDVLQLEVKCLTAAYQAATEREIGRFVMELAQQQHAAAGAAVLEKRAADMRVSL